MFPSSSRDLALDRSDHRCEVMVQVGDTWTRCGKYGTDVHHMLPKSRGGTILDDAGEIYHLVVLDRWHHERIHANPADSYLGGLTIDGQCRLVAGLPVYIGTDIYLSERYGRGEVRQFGTGR